jgi:hypothetical protein
MNLIKLFLVSETLGDSDPIIIERERERKNRSLKSRWKRALTVIFYGVALLVVIGIIFI